MAFTEEQLKKVNYFRTSVRLVNPEVEVDPAYKFTDEDLYAILETVTPAHNSDYEIDTLPKSEFYYVVLLAKKEIFYRLASSTAPFYPLSAEGAKLEKNVRFDHYLALIKVIMDEYESMTSGSSGGNEDSGGTGGVIQTYQSVVWGKPYANRYLDLAEVPFVDLTVSGITSTSANLDWTKYENIHGTHFLKYHIYFDTKPVYDDYGIHAIDPLLKSNFVIEDVRRTKIRISDLQPDTEYYVLVKTESRLGISGYSQKTFRTEAVVIPQ